MTELDGASLFFSLLGLVALAGVVAAVPLLALAPLHRGASSWRDELVAVVGPVAAPLALAVAGTALVGSLWFSEVVGIEPCTLCWYQRALIYPQVLALGVAVVRRSSPVVARRARAASLALAVPALGVSTYHYLLELYPSLDAGACSTAVPCSFVWFRRFGFLTLPGLAWLSSASIAWLDVVAARWTAATTPASRSSTPAVP